MASPPAPILPPEIIDNIIPFCDDHTLLTCALVASSWIPQSRTTFFSKTVRLDDANFPAKSQTLRALLLSPHSTFRDYLSDLNLYLDGAGPTNRLDKALLCLFRDLGETGTRLDTLRVSMPHERGSPQSADSLCRSLRLLPAKHIRVLDVCAYDFSGAGVKYLLESISGFGAMEECIVRTQGWKYEDDNFTTNEALVPPATLSSFTLEDADAWNGRQVVFPGILDWLARGPNCSLKHFSTHVHRDKAAQDVYKHFLSLDSAQGLESLVYEGRVGESCLDCSNLHALKSFTLDVSKGFPSAVTQTLALIPQSLETLDVTLAVHPGDILDNLAAAIDRLMSDTIASLPFLRVFNIRFNILYRGAKPEVGGPYLPMCRLSGAARDGFVFREEVEIDRSFKKIDYA